MNRKMVFVGLGVLLAIGGGAFYALERPHRAVAAEKPVEETPSVRVRIPFLAVPVVAAGVLQRYMIVSLTIETPSQDDADAVKKNLPGVVDAILVAFHESPDGQPVANQTGDDDALSARLQDGLARFPDAAHIRRIVVAGTRPPPR